MELNDISYAIIGSAIEVHRCLGPGLLESTYEECLIFELRKRNLHIKQQMAIPIVYKEIKLDCGYRLDVLVENKVIIELKSEDALLAVHEAQILTYMKLAEKELGLLINFNVKMLTKGIHRYRLQPFVR